MFELRFPFRLKQVFGSVSKHSEDTYLDSIFVGQSSEWYLKFERACEAH